MRYGMVTSIHNNPSKGHYAAVFSGGNWYSFMINEEVFQNFPVFVEKGNWVSMSDIRVHGKKQQLRAYDVRLATEQEASNSLLQDTQPIIEKD